MIITNLLVGNLQRAPMSLIDNAKVGVSLLSLGE